EAWKRLVLRSMPPPAWLGPDAPHSDVVLSSRSRILRNLQGHRFPHHADSDELQAILKKVIHAIRDSRLNLSIHRHISNAEREYLVGCRLASPEFEWSKPGRALMLNEERSLSIMVNEEDHLRIQAVTAGWSAQSAQHASSLCVEELQRNLEF